MFAMELLHAGRPRILHAPAQGLTILRAVRVGTHPATAHDGAQSEPYAVHSRHAERLVRMIRSGLMISQWTVTVRRTSDAPS